MVLIVFEAPQEFCMLRAFRDRTAAAPVVLLFSMVAIRFCTS